MRAVARTSLYAIDMALLATFGFLVSILAARGAAVDEFGKFALAVAIASAQQPIAAFGLQHIVYGRFARNSLEAVDSARRSIFLVTLNGVLLYGVTLVILLAVGAERLLSYYSFVGLKVVGAASLVCLATYQSRNYVGSYFSLRCVSISIFSLTLLAVHSASGDTLLYGVIWGAEGLAFALMLLYRFLREERSGTSPVVFRVAPFIGLWRVAWPIGVQTAFVVLYLRFDQVYVGYRFGDEALGVYAVGAKLAEAGNLAFQALALAVSPGLIKALAREKGGSTKYIAAGVGCFALSLLGFGFAISHGEMLIKTLYDERYVAAWSVMAIYILSTCFVAYGAVAGRVLAANEIVLVQMFAGAAGGVVNIAGSIWLGELYGLEGVAFATVLSYSIAAAVLCVPVFRLWAKKNP